MNKLLFAAVLALVLTACRRPADADSTAQTTTATTNTSSSGNPLTAPVDYLGAVSQGKIRSETTIDLASTQKAIDLFVAAEGRNPKDLQELVDQDYLAAIPALPAGKRLEYDAARATVKAVDAK